MSELVDAPKSIGQVLDIGFRLFGRSFKQVLPFTAAIAVLSALPSLVQHTILPQLRQMIGIGGAVALLVPLYLLLFALFSATIRRIDDVAERRNALTLWASFTGAWRYLPRMLGAGILYFLALIVGLVLLVVPGVFLMTSLLFYMYFVVLEDAGAIDALKRSHQLVRGHWWRTSTILAVATLIYIAVFVAVTALLALFLPIAKLTSAGTGQQDMMLLVMLAYLATTTVTTSLLSPLLYSILQVAFRELQLRKSGADLSARIESLA